MKTIKNIFKLIDLILIFISNKSCPMNKVEIFKWELEDMHLYEIVYIRPIYSGTYQVTKRCSKCFEEYEVLKSHSDLIRDGFDAIKLSYLSPYDIISGRTPDDLR